MSLEGKGYMDYGIVYDGPIKQQYAGYLKFCGLGRGGRFVFREELDNGESCLLIVPADGEKRDSTATPTGETPTGSEVTLRKTIEHKHVVSQKEDENGDIYYLCTNPARIVIERSEASMDIETVQLKDDLQPLFINVSDRYILVSGMQPCLLALDRTSLDLIHRLDLSRIDVVEPIYVEACDCDTGEGFILTDSSNHTVKHCDFRLNVLWQYGMDGVAGDDDGLLCVPVNGIRYKDHFIIAEQRNHRISIFSKDKQLIKRLGVTNVVGQLNGLLWAPQIALRGDDMYIIMCKGGVFCVDRYSLSDEDARLSDVSTRLSDESIQPVCGERLMVRSDLNFPRSCSYSPRNGLLLVADTYHDRLVAYDADGREVFVIRETSLGPLRWPRCAIWDESSAAADRLCVADSQNRRILLMDTSGAVDTVFTIPSEVAAGEWPQAVDQRGAQLMVVFEEDVVLFDRFSFRLQWSAKATGIQLKDVHFGCFTEDGRIMVADTGHHRLVLMGADEVQYIDGVTSDEGFVPLKKPRSVAMHGDHYYIANSGNSKIYICDRQTLRLDGVYGGTRGLAADRLSIPRWITHCYESTFAISDTDNHRIVLRELG